MPKSSSRSKRRFVTPAVHRFIKRALEWLPLEFDDEDEAFVARELERVKSGFEKIKASGDAPWLDDWLGSGKTTRIWADRAPRYLQDAVMLDLSACYKKRFETMGKAEGRCAALSALFEDPYAWFVSCGKKHYKKNKRLKALAEEATKVFGSATSTDVSMTRKRTKEFYTRFYGSCTPKKSGGGTGIMKSIGLLARLQNTLYIVEQEVRLRANRTKHGVVMIQTDSLTLCKSDLKDHPVYGEAMWRASPLSSSSWEYWLAHELSEPGAAEWRVDKAPQYAIFPGVVNKYAFLGAPTVTNIVGEGWAVLDTKMDFIPFSTLTELSGEKELTPESARLLLREALLGGPSVFGRILRAIPNVINIGKRSQKPKLRALLEPFVKGSSSSSSSWVQASSSRFERTPFERAIALAESKDAHHFVVGKEVNANGARVFEVVSDMSNLPSNGTYHEYFTGAVRAFAEYDPDKENPQPLPETAIPEMCASLVAFFQERMGVDVGVEVREMKRPDKEHHRHIVFEVTHEETGNHCAFWDPKDIPAALGPRAALFDPAPWHHRKSLRLPGCKKFDGAGAYEPMNGDDLSNPSVYSKYCVSLVPAEDVVFYGALPKVERRSAAAHNNLFFPSERYACTLMVRLIKKLVGDKYKITADKCELSAQVREANCVWQRLKLRCADPKSRNAGKLLDLGSFCNKLLHPWLKGRKPSLVGRLAHHRSNNSYCLWRFDGEKGALGSVGFKCFNKGERQKLPKDLWQRTRVKLDAAFVKRASEELKLDPNEHIDLVRKEIQESYQLPTLGDGKVFGSSYDYDTHSLREAIRHRLRARRNYKFLDKQKQKSGGQKTKRDQERVGKLMTSKKAWDSRFSFSAAVAYAALHAPRVVAEKVAEKEYQLVVAKTPSYKRHASEYLTRVNELQKTPATNKTLQAWLTAVY